jgi:hypothetical protein
MFLSVVILGGFTTETHAMAPFTSGPTRRYLHHIWGRILFTGFRTRCDGAEKPYAHSYL